MKTIKHLKTRRDLCWYVGRRAERLNDEEAAEAWRLVAWKLQDDLGMKDLPKFSRLLGWIRIATVLARQNTINKRKEKI